MKSNHRGLHGTQYGSFALAAALPRPLNGWAALPATIIVGLAIVVSYRLPARWLPGWMRAEIDDGRLPMVRPDKMDWVLLVLFGLVYFVGVPSLVWFLASGSQHSEQRAAKAGMPACDGWPVQRKPRARTSRGQHQDSEPKGKACSLCQVNEGGAPS